MSTSAEAEDGELLPEEEPREEERDRRRDDFDEGEVDDSDSDDRPRRKRHKHEKDHRSRRRRGEDRRSRSRGRRRRDRSGSRDKDRRRRPSKRSRSPNAASQSRERSRERRRRRKSSRSPDSRGGDRRNASRSHHSDRRPDQQQQQQHYSRHGRDDRGGGDDGGFGHSDHRGDGGGHMNGRGGSQRPPSRRVGDPCRDFANGRCIRGDQCRFLHEGIIDPESGLAIGDDNGVPAALAREPGFEVPPGARVLAASADSDRMAQLFKEAGVTTIAEYNARQKSAGVGLLRDERKASAPPPPTQEELDLIMPLLEPLPEAYKRAFLAIPGCHQHLDTRHIKTILRLNPKHAMAALHEFREAMEDISSTIRNKGGYMMGVLRKYLPGEAASGVTYDGTAVSDLEQALNQSDTFADPWAAVMKDDEHAKVAEAMALAEEDRLRLEADKVRKAPLLPSDDGQVRRLIRLKRKEILKARPNLNVLHAWEHVDQDDAGVSEDPAWHGGPGSPEAARFSHLATCGAMRAHPDYADAPLVFSACTIPRPLGELVNALEKAPHPTLHFDGYTAQTRVIYRYDKRTALVHERGVIAAPFVTRHDRTVLVAWRAADTITTGAWLRLRFSVQSGLAPETPEHFQRAPTPLSGLLLEPLLEEKNGASSRGGPRTRLTAWAIEELPAATSPAWLLAAAASKQRRYAQKFSANLSKWYYLDEPADRPPPTVPADWIAETALEDANNNKNKNNINDDDPSRPNANNDDDDDDDHHHDHHPPADGENADTANNEHMVQR